MKRTKAFAGAVGIYGMYSCERADCGWQSIAPSEEAAFEQYVDHLLDEHTRVVEADVPEGTVQVRVGDEWRTVARAEARQLHREEYGDE